MPAPTEPVVPEPTPIEDDVTTAWGNGQFQQIVSNTLEDEVQELQNEREFVTCNQNEDTVSDINETDEERGVAEPEIPTEELDEYVELEQAPAHEPLRYNLRQKKPWLQDADDYVTPQQKRPNVRRVYNNMTLKQAMEIREYFRLRMQLSRNYDNWLKKDVFAQSTSQRLTYFTS